MSYFDQYFDENTSDVSIKEAGVNMDNLIKLTIEGKMAVKSGDGFYYSVTQEGTMKREYSVFEPLSDDTITRDRTSLTVGDILIYNGEPHFCSDTDKQYTLTNFRTKQIQMIQKNDENDELGQLYTVVINPIDSIKQGDPDVDPAILLANRPENAERINLSLQIDQSRALNAIVQALQGVNTED